MCNKDEFVHLHAHSDHSLQDALPKAKALAMKMRSLGQPAGAITDHGRMGGVIDFVEGCRAPVENLDPIKPIIGCEVYTCKDRYDKSTIVRRIDEDGKEIKGRQKHNHLTLLAANQNGYRNLMRLSAIAADENVFHYEPRVDFAALRDNNEGLIALSGCLGSEMNQAFLKGDDDGAEEIVRRFVDVFGTDRYYIELQYHGIPEQKMVLPKQKALATKLGLKMVASNDVHYLDADDYKLHDIHIQMRGMHNEELGKNGKKEAYGTHQFYLKTREQMATIFKAVPDSMDNTVRLADGIEDYLKLDVPHLLPAAYVPEDNPEFITFWKQHLTHYKSNQAYLFYLAYEGLKQLGLGDNTEYRKRLKVELDQIINMGVEDYFLIQGEMVEFMRSKNIWYGIRGSGVGSLVNYCLRVCSVDPIRWNLMFERFLNPGRGTQYRISYDEFPAKDWLAKNGKQDQVQAVIQLKKLAKTQLEEHPELQCYGHIISKEIWVLENAGLATYVLDLAAHDIHCKHNDAQLWSAYFLGLAPRPDGDLVVQKIAGLPDIDTDIDDARREEVIEWARGRFGEDKVSQIGTYGTYQSKAAVTGALKTSERFNAKWGEKTHIMSQAISKTIPKKAGTTIEEAIEQSPDFAAYAATWKDEIEIAKKLVGTVSNLGVHAGGVLMSREPICDHSPMEWSASKKVLCSAYDMKNVERVGLVKYDLLGLKTYQMISLALKSIQSRYGKVIDLEKLPLDDPKVFALYEKGKTASVFQFASEGMQDTLRQVKANSVEDLIAIASLYRPGPMAFIPLYAEGKKHPEKVKYSHPIIQKHLEVTYGITVYQEQLMFLCRDLAGFDWDEVDKMRKGVSKKTGEVFKKMCDLFRKRAKDRGIPTEAVEDLLDSWETFAEYAFNRSHACSYAILSYWTAYLRVYYPADWLAACIHVAKDDDDDMALYKRECRTEGIQVVQPDVNECSMRTIVTKSGKIMLPVNSIKGVGDSACIIVENQPFVDLKDLCFKARPNSGMVKALAEATALRCFSETHGKDLDQIMEMWDGYVRERALNERQKAKEAKQKFKAINPFEDNNEGGGSAPIKKPTGPPKPPPLRSPLSKNLFAKDIF